MTGKRNCTETSRERAVSTVAAMKFWSRLKSPPQVLAFAFPEPADEIVDSRRVLDRLPSTPTDSSVVYSIKISLDGSKPTVWRRVLVKGMNLEVLHHVIQIVMGWSDSHLHGFEIRKTSVPSVEEGASVNERTVTIAQLLAARIKRFHYTYDFGDNWRHTITIEEISEAPADFAAPRCTDGKGITPLEDVGGLRNWAQLMEAIRHPDRATDNETISLRERLGVDFVPPDFDLAKTNTKLQRVFKKRGNKGY